MYLSVDEAMNKMCPLVTYCINERDVNAEARPAIMSHANCSGPGCMAWRWAGGLPATERGYCGMAGRPDLTISHLAPETGKTTTV